MIKKLQEEVLNLLDKERPEVVKVVHWAASNGDRSENGDYIYGKKRLREIDKRVRLLTKRINNALSSAAETLGFTFISSKNIFRKKRIFGELDGFKCEVEVYTRSHGRSSTTYVSFFAFFPESFDMGLKINWRGEFDGDDEYLTDLFIKRNEELIETSKKNLRRLRVEDAFVNSRKVLFRKYYKADEIVKTMRDVLNLAKAIK